MARLVVALCLIARAVHADPGLAETPFVTLDRVDGTTRSQVDVELSSGSEEEQSVHEFSTQRLEAHVQKVFRRGLGVYGAIGVLRNRYDNDIEYGATALELGGLAAKRISTGFDLVSRIGFSSGTDSDGSYFGSRESEMTRIADFARSQTDSTYLRFATSPVLRYRSMILRGDLGVDLPVTASSQGYPRRTILREGVGVGVEHRGHAGAIEYVVVGDPRNLLGKASAVMLQTLAVTYRVSISRTQLFATFVRPIRDRGAYGDNGDSLVVGVNIRFANR